MLRKLAPCCAEGRTSLASWRHAAAAGTSAPASSALGWGRRFAVQTRSKGGLTPEPLASPS
eukprot:4010311-Pyramimonas_sp.AAC.1